MTDTIIILNPTAGTPESLRNWQERVESIARGCPICVTSHAGEAEALARRAVDEGFSRVVAAGGDGTVSQVANGLAGSNAALGLLPMGTVNVFAMELGLPLHNLPLCWDIIEGADMRLVDLPNANGKCFVQLAGVGLDAQVVKETSLASKRSFGPLSYLISAAQIAARQPPKLSIESDDASVDEGSFVLVGNGRLYGGPFPFSSAPLWMMDCLTWSFSNGSVTSRSSSISKTSYSALRFAVPKLNTSKLAGCA